MQCLKGKSPLKLESYMVGQFGFQHGCDKSMKKVMDIHRYKIEITRFTHEVFIVTKREFTRYKISQNLTSK
jgi:hypothetical protein